MRGDSVLMNVPEINRKRATVKASVRLTGVKEETLVVTVAGGTIDGKTKLRRSVTGLDSRIFIVVPDPRQKKVNLTAQAGGETDSVELDFGAEIQAGGMIGSLLSIARRAPLVTTPYTDWTPDTIVVSPLAAPYRWVASGQELMGVAATKYVISFEIAHKSQYMPRGTMGYDGFVITGFNRDIEKIEVANGTDLALDVKNTAREVRIDIRGFSEPGFGFALALTFKEN